MHVYDEMYAFLFSFFFSLAFGGFFCSLFFLSDNGLQDGRYKGLWVGGCSVHEYF